MALTLYHAQMSFFSQRARLAFAEKNVKYKSVEVEIHAEEQLEPWYVRIHPLMTVPGLAVEGGTKFIDSEAIIGFVDKITPDLPPLFPDEKSAEGQKCSQFLLLFKTFEIEVISLGTIANPRYTKGFKNFASAAQLEKALTAIINKARRYSEKYKDLRYEYLNKATALSQRLEQLKDEQMLRDHLDAVESALTEVEAELAKASNEHRDVPLDEQPWLCGPHFTVADIYLATLLHRLFFIGYSYFWVDGKRPYIEKYYQRVLQRESFRKTCLHANSLFWGMLAPLIRYKVRRATPWVLGVSAVLAAGVGVYMFVRKK
ncbi:ganglioside-induced differentiation-associated protein 1-like [Patiria miniata]|uniref:Ganglioside-induced differentiation-associated protein 1 n=1 Tax=Patiria miniata TaxID=46514 RepID=A0A914BQ65_PATMI|nr:ganglioside-induced differentiation-associated protein 1-like [Patiria miniata]XP_038078433.1 ganglioside-induced differentiation-associated protein 1-like [Patiria miniata]XP_038078443.1 ganglioside-induced differentiation-associated protein 1-like [Patiria miniata]